MKKEIAKLKLQRDKVLPLDARSMLQVSGGQTPNSGFACVTTFAPGTCYRTANC